MVWTAKELMKRFRAKSESFCPFWKPFPVRAAFPFSAMTPSIRTW
jgi:hypothetical protein